VRQGCQDRERTLEQNYKLQNSKMLSKILIYSRVLLSGDYKLFVIMREKLSGYGGDL
jgi:hypothetical protein